MTASGIARHPQHLWSSAVDAPTQALLARRLVPPFAGRRPAIVAVDLYDLVYDGGARPVRELIEQYPASCGARPCESAFFSSDLERALRMRGVGSLIVCGAPTSGALRATAVEGKSYGYKVAIAEETVGDESSFLHRIALFDVAHKYADVMSLDELLAALANTMEPAAA